MNFFWPPSRPDTKWTPVGPVSAFPDIGEDDPRNLIQTRICDAKPRPGCKIFHIPKDAPAQAAEVDVPLDIIESPSHGEELTDQVLVFQYKGKVHAVDHSCPHSAYPLSNGTPFDVEDFGVVLSAGLTCPKHGWSFDLFTGVGDRGNYKLKVWETQIRDGDGEKTVWVRRKPRMG